MLQLMNDLPENVLGISAEGKITGKDYEDVLIPAVEEKLTTHLKIRMLYHLGNTFDGFDLSAILDDAKIGMKHLSAWEKVAMVSEHHLINTFAKFFGYLLPCEVRVFKNTELEEAKKWIAEP
ncbi:MAG: STAS/SEC14 domain-containing protein [Ginsengibacter sp.]